jgi:hypothetical protein
MEACAHLREALPIHPLVSSLHCRSTAFAADDLAQRQPLDQRQPHRPISFQIGVCVNRSKVGVTQPKGWSAVGVGLFSMTSVSGATRSAALGRFRLGLPSVRPDAIVSSSSKFESELEAQSVASLKSAKTSVYLVPHRLEHKQHRCTQNRLRSLDAS